MTTPLPTPIEFAIAEYTSRAQTYDNSNNAWHATLADDFITWLSPYLQPGQSALVLACGTGLISTGLAPRLGPSGAVIAIDITPSMLDIARSKPISTDAAPITWLEADITSPSITESECIKRILDTGGFDIVTVCSALVLLANPGDAVKFWSRLLKPGGRIVLDIPTEDWNLQYLSSELLCRELGREVPFSRAWITGLKSLESLVTDAGLKVTKSLRTESYTDERVWGWEEGGRVFEMEVLAKEGWVREMVVQEGREEEVKGKWMGLWDKAVGEDGLFRDGHWLYVVVGVKEEV